VLASGAVAAGLLCVDIAFFMANAVKIMDGGYVPLLLACCVYGVMWIWHRGTAAVSRVLHGKLIPIPTFLAEVEAKQIPRVPGTAVFLTRTSRDVPPVMKWHVKMNRALHQKLFALTVITESVPWVRDSERLTVTKLGPDFWRGTARYGFMERPDIPALLQRTPAFGCALHLDDVTYYIGRETIVHAEDGTGLPLWEERIYAAMGRNAVHASDFFRLPRDGVVEIGRQIAI
jgi:KUP system potassium uptake protein